MTNPPPATPPTPAADSLSAIGASGRPVALVTGAARRVGAATSLALARAGCDVVITYSRSRHEADTHRDTLAALGIAAATLPLDLADAASVRGVCETLGSLPRLDVLVHNASSYDPSPLSSVTFEAGEAAYRVNALSPFILSAALAPLLRKSSLPGGGSIVMMADIHALGRPRREFALYNMSKAALAEAINSLAIELAPQVRVNGVAPGVVAWPEQGYESDNTAQQKYLRRVPLARAGTPDDAAEAVRWLALDAHYTTGQIIRVDGGRWLT